VCCRATLVQREKTAGSRTGMNGENGGNGDYVCGEVCRTQLFAGISAVHYSANRCRLPQNHAANKCVPHTSGVSNASPKRTPLFFESERGAWGESENFFSREKKFSLFPQYQPLYLLTNQARKTYRWRCALLRCGTERRDRR